MNENPLQYICASLIADDEIFIASEIIELNERYIDHTKMLRWKQQKWAHFMVDWPVIRVCHLHDQDGLTLFVLGLNGKLTVLNGKNKSVEEIDVSRDGPQNRGPLRSMCVIDNELYVVGMQRQAYVRESTNSWRRIDEGVVLPLNSDNIKSFDSIDGIAGDDIYAAGLDGEVWHFNGGYWSEKKTPTNASLEKVLCVSAHQVFIAGHSGTLLFGSNNNWEVVELGIKDTIWDLAWFQGCLYLATMTGLYTLKDKQLDKIQVSDDPASYGSITHNENQLWSIGESNIFLTTDGKDWIEIDCQDGSY